MGIQTQVAPTVGDRAFGVGSSLKSPSPKERQLQAAIHDLAKWTHAVTVTFPHSDRYGRRCNQYIMYSALRHFIRVLNIKCFRRKQFDRGRRVSVIAAFGMGSSSEHPHCHIAIAAPANMTFPALEKLILESIRKTHWFDQQFAVKPYKSQGWIKYLLDHQEELFMDLPSPAYPSVG